MKTNPSKVLVVTTQEQNTMQLAEHEFPMLTSDQLRKFKGFENYSDEQAEKYLKSLYQFVMLFFETEQNQNPASIDQSIVITINQNKAA